MRHFKLINLVAKKTTTVKLILLPAQPRKGIWVGQLKTSLESKINAILIKQSR